MQTTATKTDVYAKEFSSYGCIARVPKRTELWGLGGDEGYLSTSKFDIQYEKVENIFIDDRYIGKLPVNLSYLAKPIAESKSILLLRDNWDDEGSVGYNRQALVAATKFLVEYANHIYKELNTKIDTPKIYPGPKGSIDVIWEFEKYRLVVNIDANGEDATFYGDDKSSQVTEGQFKVNSFYSSLLPIPA